MSDRLVHRGPDGEGHFQDGRVALGHRRLKIIDLTTGYQPQTNETEDVWVTFNGEIYNYRELRSRLIALGHRFRTQSDTECIVHAYEQWGVECLRHLRGMFAFAIWDSHKKRLFLARDRLGVKPLYYATLPEGLIFASEIKALLEYKDLNREIDSGALDAYLHLQFIPSPMTIFRGVRKLPPAHYATWESGVLHVVRYWELRFEPEAKSEDQWLDALEEKFIESVQLRLVSDVPLGAFLSGGIDSTLVVLAMSRLMREPVETFSIGFTDPRFDESRAAALIAELSGSNHHHQTVPPGIDSALVGELVAQLDEPMSDISFIPTYHLSKFAREKVTVALSGDGGDETFAGYEKYGNWLSWQQTWGRLKIPNAFRDALAHVSLHSRTGKRTLAALAQGRAGRYAELVYGYYTFSKTLNRNELYTSRIHEEVLESRARNDTWKEVARLAPEVDPLSFAQHADFLTYLPEDILMKVDKMSMLNSLEVRSPFLDHELQELVARIPPDFKRCAGTPKYLLKRLLKRWGAPEQTLTAKKLGFAPSLSYWFTRDWWQGAREDLRRGHAVEAGFLRSSGIEKIFEERNHLRCWNLWLLELWFRHYYA
jgi:asparagine synthase (glutamine-hydrolysing)